MTPMPLRKLALSGSSIEIDPNWPYYRGRSEASIADEIALAGYKCVHYVVVNENSVNGELIRAFHELGIAVWLLVFGNGSYSVDLFPDGWRSWQMELLKPSDVEGFTFLSLNCEEYKQWKKRSLARLVKEYPFDGIEIIECFLPEWTGFETGVYGDVSQHARAAFQRKYQAEVPDFTDKLSSSYYKTNQSLYEQWVQFRVDSVCEFLDEIFNGDGGVRETNPHIAVATWSLGIDAGPRSVQLLREFQGLDAASIVSLVKPDIHFFQTHWPDWQKPEAVLPPDYIKVYLPFVDQLRSQHPHLPVGLQADNGSVPNMIKSGAWQKQLDIEAAKYGFAAWTTYEYHIGGYMYTDMPTPMKALKRDDRTIAVSFNKRIDDATASTVAAYTFHENEERLDIDLTDITVDGNRVILKADWLPSAPFAISFNGIEDTPSLWLYKDYPANRVVAGLRLNVHSLPEGGFV
jgi:hypothetical protein